MISSSSSTAIRSSLSLLALHRHRLFFTPSVLCSKNSHYNHNQKKQLQPQLNRRTLVSCCSTTKDNYFLTKNQHSSATNYYSSSFHSSNLVSSSVSSLRVDNTNHDETTSIRSPGTETPPHNIYMWGTSKKGTIPTSLLLEENPSSALLLGSTSPNIASATGLATPSSSSSSSSSGIFSKGKGGGGEETIIDHPVRLNLEEKNIKSFFSGGGGGNENRDYHENNAWLNKVFCGASGTAMVLNDGRCFVMGSNKNGELGIGNTLKETTQPIHLPLPHPVSKVSLGSNFSALLTTTGDIYTFGYGGSRMNGMGCLGHGTMESHFTPTLVESLIEDGCFASDVHCGEYSMTVLTTEGEVLTCGAGSYGRLGNLETLDQLYLEPVEMIGSEDVTQIACGFAFSLALNSGGIIYAWGRNNEGQLGTGMGLAADMYAMESLPRPIEGMLEGRSVTRIAAGHTHAAAVTSDGGLFTWGMNYTHEPKLETTLLHTKIVDVSCGLNYTLALDEEGRVYSVGKGKTGVLGLASTKVSAFPILVEGIPENERVVSMSCGWAHVACTTTLK